MMVLVSGATATVRRLAGRPGLGVLVTPRVTDFLPEAVALGMAIGADNDCFQSLHPRRYKRMVQLVAGLPGLLWVACPDVVASHRRTMRRWRRWAQYLRHMGVPVAFVVQNGATPELVPWDEIVAIFVGGDTAWKLGPDAAALIVEAKARGKLVHVGRVNSQIREQHIKALGADTFDGGQYSMFPDTYIPTCLDRLPYVQTAMVEALTYNPKRRKNAA